MKNLSADARHCQEKQDTKGRDKTALQEVEVKNSVCTGAAAAAMHAAASASFLLPPQAGVSCGEYTLQQMFLGPILVMEEVVSARDTVVRPHSARQLLLVPMGLQLGVS